MLRANTIFKFLLLISFSIFVSACSKVWVQPRTDHGTDYGADRSAAADSAAASTTSRFATSLSDEDGSRKTIPGGKTTSRSVEPSSSSSSSESRYMIPEWNRSSRRLKHVSGQRPPRARGKETSYLDPALLGSVSPAGSASSANVKNVALSSATSGRSDLSSSERAPKAKLPGLDTSPAVFGSHHKYVDVRADARASMRREVRARLSSGGVSSPGLPLLEDSRKGALPVLSSSGRIKEVDEALPSALGKESASKPSVLPQARGYAPSAPAAELPGSSGAVSNPLPSSRVSADATSMAPAAVLPSGTTIADPEVITKRVAPVKEAATKQRLVKKEVSSKMMQRSTKPKKIKKLVSSNIGAARKSTAKKAPAKRVSRVASEIKSVSKTPGVAVSSEEKVEAKKPGTIAALAAGTSVTPKETVQEKKAEVAKPVIPKDRNCKEAEVEAKRARSASSEADRLFYYRRALRLCPLEPGYHIEIGRVYAELGRKDDAQFEFRKALELDPESEEAQDELSLLMMESAAF